MGRRVVVGTAGHIDHGKTALVRALTGVDTDRLAEEKARGITIDLGFAPLALAGVDASVVDVPGHEGFVRNMLAGATGVDVALLVVAADEGVMPQTREHVAILRFLGVSRGVVALTKCDLATDADWRMLVAEDVRTLIAESFGDAWPIVEVSATAGTGLEALRAALSAAAAQAVPHPLEDCFRLPVDRVFALPGAGTIVTGTVWSGRVREGDHVTVLPMGREARVRSIQVHGSASEVAEPGRRTALALVGVHQDDAARGAVIVTGEGWRATRAFDAEVRMLGEEALARRERVRVHHGTASVLARVAVLGAAAEGLAQVRFALDEPLVLRGGDRFVLRSFSPVTTIGGGTVTDPWSGETRGGRRRVLPEGMPAGDAARIVWLVSRRGRDGMAAAATAVASGLDAPRATAALRAAEADGLCRVGDWLVAAAEVARARGTLGAALDAWHATHPLDPGMPVQTWRATIRGPAALAELAEAGLLQGKEMVRDGATVRRPAHDPSASSAAQAGQERVLTVLRAADAEPPSVDEIAAQMADVDVPAVLRLLARAGLVVAVAADRYYEAGALARERERLVAALRELGAASPADIRQRLGRSRKWLIPMLEWADREGVTIRNGDRRQLAV